MASPDVAAPSPDRVTRRRPFSSWVKKLTNLKSSDIQHGKRGGPFKTKKSSIGRTKNNNPYLESGNPQAVPGSVVVESSDDAYSNRDSRPRRSSIGSVPVSLDNGMVPQSNKSVAPTVATNPDTIHSDAGQSKALTAKTGGAFSSVDGAGRNSTFSSPNQSEHSLTTTLTTIQSTSPGVVLGQQGTSIQSQTGIASQPSIQFSHQFPSGPASALPPHLAPTINPSTYSTAIANNMLTDDASIMTLASSSKRRRRRSMDTDASVRALAPSSVWGGSRESLPLSVLSANMEGAGQAGSSTQAPSRQGIGGVASGERASVYSSQSVAAPALVSDRNSYYATSLKQSGKDKDARSIDGRSINKDADERSLHGGKSLHGGESIRGYEGSIRSGALGHIRSDSNSGSLNAPLISPGPLTGSRMTADATSRRSSHQKTDGVED